VSYACALRGLPPFFPFSLAAAALASVRALPPLRPRATAGGDAITTVANSRANRSHSRLATSGSGGGCWCRRMRRFASAMGLCLTADPPAWRPASPAGHGRAGQGD
jgi:hypothetical protein